MEHKEIIEKMDALENEVKKLRQSINANTNDKEITERIKTFEDALELYEVTDELKEIIIYDGVNKFMISVREHAKLMIICSVLNEGWIPYWNNDKQYKWYPWFEMKSGVGFSRSNSYYERTGTSVGSRLCFKTEGLANYAGKQFLSIYKNYLSIDEKI